MLKSNSPTTEQISPISSWQDWFDRAAQIFDDPRMKIAYYKNGQTGEPYPEEAVRLTHEDIFNKLVAYETDAVLDVGRGVGYFTKFFSSRIKTILGVDPSPHMIEAAYAMNPHGKFFVAKGDHLPFRKKSFQRIFSYGVTQYLPHERAVEAMLDEMRRLLRNPGRILVGDILEPVHQAEAKSYHKTTVKGYRW